jgi:UDP-N-acetylmuramoyl-L-alanyl-D-glutamate--2,6-diaminopimelate ligase
VAGIGDPRIVDASAVDIQQLAYDSRRVGSGALFFCVPGKNADGHDFAPAAVKAGAEGLVVQHELSGLDVAQVLVPDVRAAMAPIAARFNRDPTKKLKVAGITGTNGKTTTAFLLREILQRAGLPGGGMQCGLLGTVKQVVGGKEERVERTTPEAIDLQDAFRRMLDGDDEACAMEVSSHALVLHRCDAIHFDVALFTNLTQDHLDFHADMEDYFDSKRRLFEMGPGTAVVNVDDPYGRRLAGELESRAGKSRCLTFSAEGAEADFVAREVSCDASGSSFVVNSYSARHASAYSGGLSPAGKEELVRTGLPGHFNIANALGAFVAARALGVDPRHAAAALAEASPPPGRFELVDAGQPFSVLVDYAHTPDSLKNVLRAARPLTSGRLIVVVGAGGDRDRDKRPKMGRAATSGADLAIITSDNPRSEDPETIVAEVRAGAEEDDAAGAGGSDAVVAEVDRRTAIALALGEARPGDTVVIAGKGHEQGQEFEDGRKVPFDDREVAREELHRLLRTGQSPTPKP